MASAIHKKFVSTAKLSRPSLDREDASTGLDRNKNSKADPMVPEHVRAPSSESC